MACAKDHKALLRRLRQAGHEVSATRKGHVKVVGNGATVILPGSPGKGRAFANSVALLKRNGLL